jgi:hypothetical protein
MSLPEIEFGLHELRRQVEDQSPLAARQNRPGEIRKALAIAVA